MRKFLISLSLSAVLLFALTGCGDRTDKISASCYIDGVSITLPFAPDEATTFGWGCNFVSEKSLEEIAFEALKLNSDGFVVSANVVGHYAVIELKTNADTHYFTVTQTKTNAYQFCAPTLYLGGENVMFPNYLFEPAYEDLEAWENTEPNKPREMIKTSAPQTAFAEFYRKMNVFDVVEAPNKITVSAKDGVRFYRDSIGKKPFEIVFETRDGGGYATYRSVGFV